LKEGEGERRGKRRGRRKEKPMHNYKSFSGINAYLTDSD